MVTQTIMDTFAKYIQNSNWGAFTTAINYNFQADALNSSVIAKSFELKERPSFGPLIVHIVEPDFENGIGLAVLD